MKEILVYPSNLNELYKSGSKNYIQFSPITFNNAKFITQNKKKSVESKPDMESAIILELGENLNISDNHSWAGGDTLGNLTWSGSWDTMKQIASRIGREMGVMGAGNVASKVANFVGSSIDANLIRNQYELSKGKTIINPNTTLVYNSTEPRSLSLLYIMRPIDENEAKVILSIVKKFKKFSRGTLGSDSMDGINFPNLWRLKTSSKVLNSYLESGEESDGFDRSIPFACTTVGTNVSTDQMYHNEYPDQIDLSLSFVELRPRYRTEE